MRSHESAQFNKADPEMVRVAENLLQLHYHRLITGTDSPLGSIEDDGLSFRKWFETPEGTAVMNDYVLRHTPNQIGNFEDMETLEKLYLEFKNRTIH